MAATLRVVVLAAVLVLGAGILYLVNRPSGPAGQAERLTWVATAHQLGVVGYRDPVGALSPDGRVLAYAEGAVVRVVPVGGGPPVSFPPAEGQVRHLAWSAGSDRTLVAEDTRGDVRWWLVDTSEGTRVPLFGDRTRIDAEANRSGPAMSVETSALRYVHPSPDGRWLAAIATGNEGAELWRIAFDGTGAEASRVEGRLSPPSWAPSGDIACVVTADGRSRITIPCGEGPLETRPDVDAAGPLAFSPDGDTVYFASPNQRGMVDLWSASLANGHASRLTAFDRDTYAPTVATDGTVLFKTQSYRTFVSETELASGESRQLATFQTETPSYRPDGQAVAVTFGTWRRMLDDVNYPDIAQHIGLIASRPVDGPASEPIEIIAQSVSEDQAMTWSPNGRWIAFHSHREMSDDVWLRPADGSAPDTRITFLGRGAEVGWPRWSPDGRDVLLDGASPTTRQSVMFVIGVDQESGQTTSDLREIEVTGVTGDISHAEWLGSSDTIVALAREGRGRHVIFTVPASGGAARVVHRFSSEHDFPGLAASPDGLEVAFIQPAADGFFQVFRLPVDGSGTPTRVTTDPSHKTQPAWSPDGTRIAYTVWSYLAHFWTMAGK